MQPSVELARIKKSIALADLLFAHGITAEDTALMTCAEWTMAARVARVNPPHSAETRQMICAMLQKRARGY
jgi:hypothetical protein